ncbi:sugar phosphate nucleotidyltransferase [Gorillibacterium timonense]|uniref:sugar phosphate nucleotidyltransferase n=1 Tax=Gorillibacterium timonense TaxID=1689269 RepID=UPI00071C7B85|nr:sugar phosphate nucleotidyltransferase [Gorillibacterium timonense]
MRVVLLSGGSGKRLWPLSNEIRSKAYLRLLQRDQADRDRESMIQRICRQLEAASLLKDAVILTHESQVEITRAHVGDAIPILSEPLKRGTFTAIALAASYYHSRLGVGPEEPLCVLPVDSYVDAAFFELVRTASTTLSETGAKLVLIGTKPTGPSSQFGYIVPQNSGAATPNLKGEKNVGHKLPEGSGRALPIASFAEKPEENVARELIAKGALWNCGVFAFTLGFVLSCLRDRGLPTDFDELLARYPNLPEKSFDQEVVERTDSAAVLPYSGAWEDLGSWSTFATHLGSVTVGAGQVSSDSRNTHIVNELAVPIQVIGLSDAIVAASADGILVAAKEEASRIKSYLAGTKPEIRFEEKRWGTRCTLDIITTGHPDAPDVTVTSKIEMKQGHSTGVHAHESAEELLIVLAGRGELSIDGEPLLLKTGDAFRIPRGAAHSIEAKTDLIGLEIHRRSSENDSHALRQPLEHPQQ